MVSLSAESDERAVARGEIWRGTGLRKSAGIMS